MTGNMQVDVEVDEAKEEIDEKQGYDARLGDAKAVNMVRKSKT